MGSLTHNPRRRRSWSISTRPGTAVALALILMVAWPAVAAGPQIMLGDGCVEADRSDFDVPLILLGEEYRPSTLRASLFFDPMAIAPGAREGRPTVEPGPALDGRAVLLSFEVDQRAGRVDVVLNSEGRRPVPPLREGTLARIHLRLLPGARQDGALRLDLDPGQVRSLDGNGNEMFTAVTGPAFVWVGQTGPWLAVGGVAGQTFIEAYGDLVRDQVWILRGRLSQLSSSGRRVTLGPLDPLPGAGRLAADGDTPRPGEVFFYVAAQPDSSGRPLVGFGASCRERMPRLGPGGKGAAR